MKRATKKALLESIEHWRENEQVKKIEDAKVGSDYCALCKRFNSLNCSRTTKNGEEFCPVHKATGREDCNGSPYYEVQSAYLLKNLKSFIKAAKKEREFLESLLPAEK